LKFKWYAAESGPPILFSSPETISEKSTTVEFPLWFLKSKREFAPFRKPLPKHAAVHNVGKLRTWLNILDPAELSKRAKLIAHVIDESKHGLLEPLPHREVAQGAEASAGSVNYFLRGDELLRVETSPDDSSISSVTWPLKSGKAWLKNNLGGIAPPVFAGDGNPTLLLAGKTAESAPTADLVAQNLWILTPDEELRPFGRHKDAKPGSEDFRDSLYSIAELAARPHWVDFLQEQTAVGIPRQPTDKPGDATLANSHRLLTPVNLEQSGDVWNRVIFKDADKADTTFTLAVSKPPAVKPGEPKRKRKRVESLRTAVPSDLRRYLASHPTDDAKLTFRWRSASGGYGPRFVLRMPSTNDPLIGESKLPVWVGGDGIGTARSLFSKYRFGTSPVVKDGLAFVHEEILDSPEVVRRLLNTKSNQPFRVHIPPPVKKKTVTLLAPPAAGEKHGGLLFVLQRQPKTRLTALQLEPTVALESFLVSVQQAKNDAANLSMDTSVSENFEEVFWDQLVAEQQKAMEERHTLIFAGQLLKEGQMPPSATMADEQNRQTGYAYLAKSDGAYKRYVTYIDAQNKVQILKGERNVELSSFPRNSIDGVDFQSKATAEWARWSATLRAVLQFQGKQSRARDAGWKPVLPYRLIKD
jgi:hypothetical protein